MAGKSASILINILGDAKSALDAADKTESRFDQLGGKLGKLGLAVGAGIAAGGVAAVVGLEKLGATFDDAMDGIAVKTGATGEELAGLEDSFKGVFESVPVSADEAALAIGTINQQLGLSGEPLEALSTQLLNLSRITDTDLATNVDSVTRLFNQFGIAAEDQGSKLDDLFAISQETGVSVGDLATQMTDGGVAFREAGLSFEETAGMLGVLGKAGLDAGDVMPALNKTLAEAAKTGQDASELFEQTFDAIRAAPDDTAAAGIALETFGSKAGPKFAAMIRDGTLSFEEFAGVLDEGALSINDTAASTDDWREKLQLLMNKGMVALEPIATKVFTKIGELVEWASPYLERFGVWLGVNLPIAADKLSQAFQWFSTNVMPVLVQAFEAISTWVQTHWPQIQQTITDVLTTVQQVITAFVEVVQLIWRNFGEQIAAFIEAKFNAIMGVIDGVLQVIRGIVQTVTALIHGDWSKAWEGVQQIFEGIWTAIVAAVTGFINEMRAIIDAVLQVISGIWSAAWEGIKSALSATWEGIKSLVSAGVDAVVGFVTGIPGRLAGVASSLFSAVETGITTAWDGIKTTVSGAVDEVVGFVAGIPGRLGELVGDMTSAGADIGGAILDGIGEGIAGTVGFFGDLGAAAVSAMKSAANDVIDAINDALEFKINGPGPLPDITLDPPDLPHFHSGGVVPGIIGSETLAVLQAGETVRTRAQEAALYGGGMPSHITVMIGAHEFEAVLIEHDRATVTRAQQGRR